MRLGHTLSEELSCMPALRLHAELCSAGAGSRELSASFTFMHVISRPYRGRA